MAAPKKRAAKTSPTARTLQACRKLGWLAGAVEKYNAYTKRKNDLFGFADVVAVAPLLGHVVLIQATADCNHMGARQRKMEGRREECFEGTPETDKECKAREQVGQNVLTCLRAGVRVEVWGWRKIKVARGKKAVRWEVLRRQAVLYTAPALRIEWQEVE